MAQGAHIVRLLQAVCGEAVPKLQQPKTMLLQEELPQWQLPQRTRAGKTPSRPPCSSGVSIIQHYSSTLLPWALKELTTPLSNPLHRSALSPSQDGCLPLSLAVEAGNPGVCKELLSAHAEAQLRAQEKVLLHVPTTPPPPPRLGSCA